MSALVGLIFVALAMVGAYRVLLVAGRMARRTLRALARRIGYALVHVGTREVKS